jgi:hypothetical protein
MGSGIDERDQSDRILEIRKEYIKQEKPNLKALSVAFEFPYSKLLEIAKKDNWKEYRTNGKDKINLNGEACPSNTSLDPHEKGQSGDSENNSHNESGEKPPTDQKQELEILRRTAFDLASGAAVSVATMENFSPKEFDLLVGTYVKIVGAQAKLAGLEDGIDRLISELTQQDAFLAPFGEKEEADDEQ